MVRFDVELCTSEDDDTGSICSAGSSVNTDTALSEMLGLSISDFHCLLDEEKNEQDDNPNCSANDLAFASSHLSVSRLHVPKRCSRYLHDPSDVCAFVITNFLTSDECTTLIDYATSSSMATGFHYINEAGHIDDDGIMHIVKLNRANEYKLSVFEHPPTIDLLWTRMQHIIQPHINKFVQTTKCGPPMGLNPRLRILRYDAHDNDIFKPHFDAATTTNVMGGGGDTTTNMTSLLTVLIYLNDGNGSDFSGGETHFIDHSINPKMSSSSVDDVSSTTSTLLVVVPQAGNVVIFEHDLYHSSAPLTVGTKFVLRTDVLFEYRGDVDKPRNTSRRSNEHTLEIMEAASWCTTLLDVCHHISLSEELQQSLNEIGLLDLTLDSLLAPGITLVREMLRDVLDEASAERLINAILICHR